MGRRALRFSLGVLAVTASAVAAGTSGAAQRSSAQTTGDPCANLSAAVTAECRKGVAACTKASAVSAALEQKCLAELTKGLDPLRKKAGGSTSSSSSSNTDTGSSTGDSGASAAGVSKRTVSTTRSHMVASATTIPADGLAPILVHVILKDPAGGAISGYTVHLHAPGSGAKVLPASGVSDGSGVATFKVTDSTAEHVALYAQVESGGKAVVLSHALPLSFTTPAPSAAHSSITCSNCQHYTSPGLALEPGWYACLNNCTNGSSINLDVTIDDAAGVPISGYQFWLAAETSPIQSPAAFFDIEPNTWATAADPQNKGLYRGVATTNAHGKASLTVYVNTLRFKDDPGTATFLICAPLSTGPYFASFEALYKGAN